MLWRTILIVAAVALVYRQAKLGRVSEANGKLVFRVPGLLRIMYLLAIFLFFGLTLVTWRSPKEPWWVWVGFLGFLLLCFLSWPAEITLDKVAIKSWAPFWR